MKLGLDRIGEINSFILDGGKTFSTAKIAEFSNHVCLEKTAHFFFDLSFLKLES